MKSESKKYLPQVTTSSLPDIVFMLLFFFMVSTIMREENDLVKTNLPYASETQKLEDKSLIGTIRIGQPLSITQYGTADRIQLNDVISDIHDISEFTEQNINKLPENQKRKYTTLIKADKTAGMKLITDVKRELRKANALKLSYASTPD